jgi:hypothetical protein
MRHVANDRTTRLASGMAVIVVALTLVGCKDRMPPDPRSPPKPRMERATGERAGERAVRIYTAALEP